MKEPKVDSSLGASAAARYRSNFRSVDKKQRYISWYPITIHIALHLLKIIYRYRYRFKLISTYFLTYFCLFISLNSICKCNVYKTLLIILVLITIYIHIYITHHRFRFPSPHSFRFVLVSFNFVLGWLFCVHKCYKAIISC